MSEVNKNNKISTELAVTPAVNELAKNDTANEDQIQSEQLIKEAPPSNGKKGLANKNPSFLRSITDKFISFDVFGQPIQLKVDGRTHQRTGYGACCTCAIFLVVIWFLSHLVLVYTQRADELRMHKKVLQPGDERGYVKDLTFYAGSIKEKVSETDEFANSHIFNVAFGLSDYPDQEENVEDYLYGNLEAMTTYREEDGTISYKPAFTGECTEDYLLNNFYPALKSSVNTQIQFNRKKLRCFKDSDKEEAQKHYKVFGEYDEPLSQTFSIFLTSCDTLIYPNCKTPEQVSEWLKYKYLILVFTESSFSHETGKAVQQSKMHRIPLNSLQNTNYKFQL